MDDTHDDAVLARRIEAGVLAQEVLDHWEELHDESEAVDATREELQALVALGVAAHERLVSDNLGLVSVIAWEIARQRGLSRDDLFQEGCLALHQAVVRYDWRKGRFGPYAGMWIRNAIKAVKPFAYTPLDENTVCPQAPHGSQAIEDDWGDVLDLLPQQTREVVSMRVGWGRQRQSVHGVAQILDLSEARVRRIERQGYAQLRQRWAWAEAA